MTASSEEITRMLQAWHHGDTAALNRLIPLVYDELRRTAKRYMAKQKAGQTLQTTALINEAYIRLVDQQHVEWRNRAHFFAICAKIMRRILIDRFRRRRYVPLEEAALQASARDVDLIALDDALDRLAALDRRKSEIVEMHFFGGMTEQELAEVVNLSLATVKREWKRARAWLYRELSEEQPH